MTRGFPPVPPAFAQRGHPPGWRPRGADLGPPLTPPGGVAGRQLIGIELDKLPEAYTPEIYETKCALAYRHVYDHYVGPGESVYEGAAA